MSFDLTEAVEAAAIARFDRAQVERRDGERTDLLGTPWQWKDLTEREQHTYRVLVLPMVTEAMSSAVVQAWDEGYLAAESHDNAMRGWSLVAGRPGCPMPEAPTNPYEESNDV